MPRTMDDRNHVGKRLQSILGIRQPTLRVCADCGAMALCFGFLCRPCRSNRNYRAKYAKDPKMRAAAVARARRARLRTS